MVDSAWKISSSRSSNQTPDFMSNLHSRTTTGILSQQETLNNFRRSYQFAGDHSISSFQDYICKHDFEVQNVQVIGLSRQKNDGKRYIAIGGKTDPQVLSLSTHGSETDIAPNQNSSFSHDEIAISVKIKYKHKGQGHHKQSPQVEDLQWGQCK